MPTSSPSVAAAAPAAASSSENKSLSFLPSHRIWRRLTGATEVSLLVLVLLLLLLLSFAAWQWHVLSVRSGNAITTMFAHKYAAQWIFGILLLLLFTTTRDQRRERREDRPSIDLISFPRFSFCWPTTANLRLVESESCPDGGAKGWGAIKRSHLMNGT